MTRNERVVESRERQIDGLRLHIEELEAQVAKLKRLLLQVIGDHTAPNDCYSTGPNIGDARDRLCPACEALSQLKQITAVKYGCHADLDPGMEPDDCVIPRNDFEDCIFAKPGMKPEDCEYWKPVREKK